MKTFKTLLLTALFAIVAFVSKGQDYNSDLSTLVDSLRTPKPNYLLLASQFQSLAEGNTDRWEASYYFVYSTIMQAYGENGEKIDQLLDSVEPVLAQLEAKMPKESEFLVLEAMLNQARIKVSPMSRGMKYSQKYNELLEKAIALNPENPRAYLIKGLGIINMPAMFGGGKKNAKPQFEIAMQKFGSFVAPSPLFPSWGKELNQKMLDVCSQ